MELNLNVLRRLTLLLLMLSTILPSSAAYTFSGVSATDYYTPTSYETVFGAQFKYNGLNPSSFHMFVPAFGLASASETGITVPTWQASHFPVQGVSHQPTVLSADPQNAVSVPDLHLENLPAVEGVNQSAQVLMTRYTGLEGMILADGSIGTVSVPSLGITRKVWEGETTESMAKGMAHYSSSSAWDGNVCLCVHNRGSANAAGQISTLNAGEEIIYSTARGCRTYLVASVSVIANDDWTALQPTADNRLTITTCLADHPENRVCVQAVEK